MKKWLLLLILGFVAFTCHAEPPPASEVFQLSTKLVDPNSFMIHLQVKPGYFLYSDRIKLSELSNNNTARIGSLLFPPSLKKIDSQGKSYPIYREKLSLPVAILGENPGESLINLHYQGCSDDGFCYPPQDQTIKITIDKNLALTAVNLEDEAVKERANTPTVESPEESMDTIENIFLNKNWATVLLSFFGFGLLLSFTPCILPMVPVLSGIIVGHGANLSTRKAFFLSLSYVMSMSLTYAVVGAVVAKIGSNLQVILQVPLAIAIFSAIFVVLALSMFGFFELRLPVSWQARLAKLSRNQASGHYLSAAIMGSLSVLILSPCITAPLIGALGYIAHTGNMVLGSAALFFLGLGIGTPLILIGTSAGRWLPKAGKWMNAVKAFFGVLLLAVAIFLLERILPGPLALGLWASLGIFSGVYCGAFVPSSSNLGKFGQGLGLICFIYGALLLVGAAIGSTNPLQPLAGLSTGSTKPTEPMINSLNDLKKAITDAKGKPVLIDFYADWCASCQLMEATVFKDPRVREALKDFVVLKVDITANREQEKALLNLYKVIAPPTYLFLNLLGEEQPHLRVIGETSTKEFLNQLTKAIRLDKSAREAL